MLSNLTSIGFTNFLDVSSLIFFVFTNADVVTIKDLNKIRETNGGKIKEQNIPLA
jgi:hypothetical protein